MSYFLAVLRRLLTGRPLGEICVACRHRVLGHAHTSRQTVTGRTVYRHYPNCPTPRRKTT